MNGLGILIPNADFSGSPLGKVTIAKSYTEMAKEALAPYIATVGNTYEPHLVTMVASLMQEGLWKKIICLSPMLGSSVSELTYNIADASKHLMLLPNATVGTNSVSFCNTVSHTAETADDTNTFKQTAIEPICEFVSFKWIKNSVTSTVLFFHKGTGSTNISFSNSSSGMKYGNSVFTEHPMVDGGKSKICFRGNTESTLAIIDGNEYSFGKIMGTAGYNIYLSRYIGGNPYEDVASSSGSGKLFNGDVYMYAIAELDTDAEVRKFNEILTAFEGSIER